MKKVENYLETLKLKKCLFGGIAPKQIEIVIQEICMLYDLELYNKNNELEQERKKNEQQDIRIFFAFFPAVSTWYPQHQNSRFRYLYFSSGNFS